MQENHRNWQEESDVVKISKPFTITGTALNRHFISSADYNWLKQRPTN